MLTSWSDVSTPAELSIASVLMSPPAHAYSMRPSCVRPRLPPSATTLQRSSRPSTRIASFARSPTCACVSFELLTYVPMPPLYSRSTFALRIALRSSCGGSDSASMPSAARACGDSGTDFALREARLRIEIRIDEDVTVIERGDELDMCGQQHAIAEHVARHVADAHGGEIGHLRVDAHLAEMPLDRLPDAARGDAHRLVVVADGAAGRERVAEPVTVFGRHRVRVIGERRRALVGGDDEIRVVRVVPTHLRRRDDGVADTVVGHIEQAPQVILIAGDALLHEGVAVGRGRRLFQNESSLRADRHDDDVLHHLRLDEAEDLGAEVLGPVRPAKPAARDLSA